MSPRMRLLAASWALGLSAVWSPSPAAADLDVAALLTEMDAKPVVSAPIGEAPEGTTWALSRSRRYALPVATFSADTRGALPNTGQAGWWSRGPYFEPTGFELKIDHMPDGSWIKAHTSGLPRAGIESALRAEAAYAKELVDFDADSVVSHVSLETYRASALYCGRLRGSSVDHVCSLVHVLLHDGSMIRFHSLIIGETPARRDQLVRVFSRALAGVVVHP